mgnify:CR=1 FL=1
MPRGHLNKSVITPNTGSTSCPEDVNYLTFPMGPFLNISEDVSRAELLADREESLRHDEYVESMVEQAHQGIVARPHRG